MFFRLAAPLAFALVAVACVAEEPGPEPTATATLPATPPPTLISSAASATPPAGMEATLREALATRLGVPVASTKLLSFEAATWPNGCLGLGGPGVVCSQALVPGWLAILSGPDGREYRYRGTGERFVPEP